MKKTVKKTAKKAPVKKRVPSTFTPEEIATIQRAAARTWNYIAEDSLQLEGPRMTRAGAIELIIDADRLVSCGGLSPELNARVYKMTPAEERQMFPKCWHPF